jgi:hypothetical protein
MRLTKKQRKIFSILVAIASLGLLINSLLPLFYSFR